MDGHCRRVGFVPIGLEWRSFYFHPQLKLFLVIYVDDFKLAGPTANLKKGWALLRKKEGIGLDIEPERRVDTKGATYLGCRQTKKVKTLSDGRKVTVFEYDMQEFLEAAVRKYEQLAQPLVAVKHSQGASKLLPLRSATTPFLPDDHRASTAGGTLVKAR